MNQDGNLNKLEREFAVMKQLQSGEGPSHPNLMQLRNCAFNSDATTAVLEMEFAPCSDLFDYAIRDGRCS